MEAGFCHRCDDSGNFVQDCGPHDDFSAGLPHLSTEDDVYNGYFIPQNTLIIANQRWEYSFFFHTNISLTNVSTTCRQGHAIRP